MSPPIVKIKQGELKGKICEDFDGNAFFGFLGIPYAMPPLGELRFKAPQPPEPWEGIRDATEDGSGSYAFDMMHQKLAGSEDCLFLNVYTNQIPSNKKNLKPVMVWVHGGAFVCGSCRSDFTGPEFLICEDVVVVAINYRLGILGFLSLNDPKLGVSGNAGLKDMVMALKWVKNNIQAFNGDPNNVTIFGESAGGAAVHYLMLSPMAKDLFHKVIAQSGTATDIWANGKTGGEEIASGCGFESKNEEEILNFLQNADKEEILQAQLKCADPFVIHKRRCFGPVIEKSNYEECFLQNAPIDVIRSGNYNKVPLMMGYTSREGMTFHFMQKELKTDYTIIDFEDCIPHTLNLPRGSRLALEVANKIKNFYFGNKDPQSDEAKDDNYKLLTDALFLRGISLSVRNHVETSNTPVYIYRLSIQSDLNMFSRLYKNQTAGVCHGDDLGYLFKTPITPEIRSGSLEIISLKRFIGYFTNFAKHGNPNPPEYDELFPVIWKSVTKDSVNFVDINENLTVGCNPEHSRMKFWDSIFSMCQQF